MKRIKRIVDTGFWSDEKVMNFSPEDKYFWLFLLTNEYTSQLGVYYLPIKKAAFDLGWSIEAVRVLLERFEIDYNMIRFSEETSEVAIKNYLLYSIVKGGKPVYDCLCKEAAQVKDKSLLEYVCHHLGAKEIDNDTVKMFICHINNTKPNDNDNDNDNERIVDESWTNRKKAHKTRELAQRNIIPPNVEWVRSYCQEKGYAVDAERFCDYYTSKGWMVGKSKMRDWQASVRTWAKNDNTRKEKQSVGGFELKV